MEGMSVLLLSIKIHHKNVPKQGMSPWWPLPGLLFRFPILKSNHCNSFEDWAPVDEIYGCPIFKWVAVAWLQDKYEDSSYSNRHQVDMPYLLVVTSAIHFFFTQEIILVVIGIDNALFNAIFLM